MAGIEIDVTAIVALWLSGMLLLLLVLGVVIRFSGVPLIVALAEYRRRRRVGPTRNQLEVRISSLEARLTMLEVRAGVQEQFSMVGSSEATAPRVMAAGVK